MSNTYTQIYIHGVFAVEGRQNLIHPEHNDELQKYITGIVSGQKQKLIAINNMPDHVHLLIGLKPDVAPTGLGGLFGSVGYNYFTPTGLGASSAVFQFQRFPITRSKKLQRSKIFVEARMIENLK